MVKTWIPAFAGMTMEWELAPTPTLVRTSFHEGSVEKIRQRRSRPFAVLTYKAYAPRAKTAAALLDELF